MTNVSKYIRCRRYYLKPNVVEGNRPSRRRRNGYFFWNFQKYSMLRVVPQAKFCIKYKPRRNDNFVAKSVNFGQFRHNLDALAVVNWEGSSYGLPKCCQNDSFFLDYPRIIPGDRYYGTRKGWYFENISEFPPIPTDPTKCPINEFSYRNKK